MNDFDILFVNTPMVRLGFNLSGIYPMPHLGLGYLAAILEKQGYRIGYLDAQFPDQDPLKNPNVLSHASIYALTAKIMNLSPTHEIARIIHRTKPDGRVVLGGPCSIVNPRVLFDQFPGFDILAAGDGERVIVPLVEAILAGKANGEMTDIAGLSLRTTEGIKINDPVEPADLSKELYPLRTLWRLSVRRMHPPYGIYPPVTLVETARGCSYACTFCVISRTVRERPIHVVLHEVERLVTEDGIKEIHFVDPTFTLNQERIRQLCNAFKTIQKPFKWSCKTRTDCVNPELLKLMADSGCYLIAYGIESGAQAILDSLNKQVEAERTKRAILWTDEAGIRSIGYVLVGSQKETDQTMTRTNRFLRGTKLWFVLFGINMPVPKSDIGTEEGPSFNYEVNLLRYYTAGEAGPFMEIAPSGHTNKRLNRWLLRSIFAFYLYPPSIIRILRGITTWNETVHYLRGAGFLFAELARFTLRRRVSTGEEKVLFGDVRQATSIGTVTGSVHSMMIRVIRKLEIAFFRSPFSWVFGFVQKYFAGRLYREEGAKLVDDTWNGQRILDVGCGHGTFLLEVSRITKDTELMGVDLSPHLIRFARRSVKSEGQMGIEFEVMDAHDLKLPDNQFDRVISTSSVYLWQNPVKALNEIHRVLKSGGKASICDQMRANTAGKIYRSVVKQRIYGFGIPAYTNDELMNFFNKSLFEDFRFWTNDMVIWFEAVKR